MFVCLCGKASSLVFWASLCLRFAHHPTAHSVQNLHKTPKNTPKSVVSLENSEKRYAHWRKAVSRSLALADLAEV